MMQSYETKSFLARKKVLRKHFYYTDFQTLEKMQRTQSFTQLNKVLRNNIPNMGKTYQKKNSTILTTRMVLTSNHRDSLCFTFQNWS